jgi:hypothetical protein
MTSNREIFLTATSKRPSFYTYLIATRKIDFFYECLNMLNKNFIYRIDIFVRFLNVISKLDRKCPNC